jgi:hypothetical protein
MRPPVAGVAIAVLLDWLLCPAPRPPTLTIWGLLVHAIPYVLLTALGSGFAAGVFVESAKGRGTIAARVAGAAVWSAPLIVLMAGRSPWALVPLVVLVASATLLFPAGTGAEGEVGTRSDLSIAPDALDLPEVRLLRQLPASLSTAFCLQAAAVAGLADRPLITALMLAVGVALLSRQAVRAGPEPRRTGLTRESLMIALAGVFTIVAMLPYVATGSGSASSGHGRGDGGGATVTDRSADDSSARFDAVKSYRGVILWPPVQQHVTLVPPMPAGHDPFRTNQNPLDIPFYGAYWFFRPPSTRPPAGSIEMHGEPTDLTFRSESAQPLLMEARQNLGKLIDLSCCSRIEVAIGNRERYAATVSIGLTLVNTSLPEKPFQSLGTEGLTSSPGFTAAKARTTTSEVLRFPIPGTRLIRQFDEIVVRFLRVPVRSHESANISIERFVLIPVGR